MKERQERFDVGVMVARFQVPSLHEAHRALIDHVRSEHDKVVIFLGVSPLWVTKNNPLDFEARKQMLAEVYPDINVLYIKDVDNDRLWSKRLDGMITDLIHPTQTAVLYGSRDSFLAQYQGSWPVRELESTQWVSGSEIRRQVARAKAVADESFRAGVIWASQARFPTVYGAVDVAPIRRTGSARDKADALAVHDVLLVRKPDEPMFRFVGGFTDPACDTDEEDAAREALEEAGVTVGSLTYIGSKNIDDWRYRPERDVIRSRLFVASGVTGRPDPQDDEIAEARWFPLGELRRRDLMPAHRPLLVMLRDYLTRDTDEGTGQ